MSDPRKPIRALESPFPAPVGDAVLWGLVRSLLARVSFAERALAKFSLATHHIQHVDAITIVTVEDPAGGRRDPAIAPATQSLWCRAAVRVPVFVREFARE